MAVSGRSLIAQVNLRALFWRSCVIAALLIPIGLASTSVVNQPELSPEAAKIPVIQQSRAPVQPDVMTDYHNYSAVQAYRSFSEEPLRRNFEVIESAARIHKLDPQLLRAVLIVNQLDWPAGEAFDAYGLMRLSSERASELQVSNPNSERQSILAGAAFLNKSRLHFPRSLGLALGAYRSNFEIVESSTSLYAIPEAVQYAEAVLQVYARLIGEDPTVFVRRNMPERPRDTLRWLVRPE